MMNGISARKFVVLRLNNFELENFSTIIRDLLHESQPETWRYYLIKWNFLHSPSICIESFDSFESCLFSWFILEWKKFKAQEKNEKMRPIVCVSHHKMVWNLYKSRRKSRSLSSLSSSVMYITAIILRKWHYQCLGFWEFLATHWMTRSKKLEQMCLCRNYGRKTNRQPNIWLAFLLCILFTHLPGLIWRQSSHHLLLLPTQEFISFRWNKYWLWDFFSSNWIILDITQLKNDTKNVLNSTEWKKWKSTLNWIELLKHNH